MLFSPKDHPSTKNPGLDRGFQCANKACRQIGMRRISW